MKYDHDSCKVLLSCGSDDLHQLQIRSIPKKKKKNLPPAYEQSMPDPFPGIDNPFEISGARQSDIVGHQGHTPAVAESRSTYRTANRDC